MSTSIRVLLVDDHELIRRGIRQLLKDSPDIEIVAEAGNGAEAVRLTQALAPDVVVMDIQMPAMDGIAATGLITAGGDGPKVIALSSSDQGAAYAMLAAGATEFIAKERAVEDLGSVIRRIHSDRDMV